MSLINPISGSRVSNLLTQQQATNQLQVNQSELLRLQIAISTGRAFQLPSESSSAALRAISLQGLLEEKGQIQKNLQTNQSYLAASDTAASSVAGLLADARSLALQGADSNTGPTGRQGLADQVDQIVNQILGIGNQQFRGRYLFAGTNSGSPPYRQVGNIIKYAGNDSHIQSFSDVGVLFDTNVSGSELLGGISTQVQGTIDLNPRVTAATRLRDLHGGQGITKGTFQISDGTNSTTIDISRAETLGDVAALIEKNPPPGRQLRTTITAQGLNVELLPTVPATPGNLKIQEIGLGTTARDLLIFNDAGVGVGTIVGQDLNPRLTLTSPLTNSFGVRSSARVFFPGESNDLLVEARNRGAEFNGVNISFVDGGPGVAGNETAVYDDSNPLNKTLVVTIAEGTSTANDVIAAINATSTFQARLDPADPFNIGTGYVQATATNPQASGVTGGGSGIEPDFSAGLRITNNGQTVTVDLSAAQTVEDLLNILGTSGADVVAEINASGTGINLRSRLSGTDFSVGENGGRTATDLGLRTFTGSTRLQDLNHGTGVDTRPTGDFQIRRKDGTIISISLGNAVTVDDVLTLINTDAANPNDAFHVIARLATNGNGIELATSSAAGTATLAVLSVGSPAAHQLGLLKIGQTESDPAVVAGAEEYLSSVDVNPLEGQGVLNALVRLREALRGGDQFGIQRAADLLSVGTDQFNLVRSTLGSRQQSIDSIQTRLQSEQIDLKGALSLELDADLVQVISEFTSRQAAFEATLQLIGLTSKLSLLDFI
ncbi:MAG: hypothetical protein AB7O62_03855 [Pirellulales bacterium]